jgi:hypothetical protein
MKKEAVQTTVKIPYDLWEKIKGKNIDRLIEIALKQFIEKSNKGGSNCL